MKTLVGSSFVLSVILAIAACEGSAPPGVPSLEEAIVAAARHQIRDVAPNGAERLDPTGFPHEHASIEWVADALELEIGRVTFSGEIGAPPDPPVDAYIAIGGLELQDGGEVVVLVEVYRKKSEPYRGWYGQIDAVSMYYDDGGWQVGDVKRVMET